MEVRRTRHGRGAFALIGFAEEDVIQRVRGRITDDDSTDPRYIMEMDNDLFLLPHAPFRFLNHSCEPNCQIFMYEEDEVDPRTNSRPLYLGAVRPIRRGEELTIDYKWPAFFAIPCQCGTPSCRGWIVDREELDLIPTDREIS